MPEPFGQDPAFENASADQSGAEELRRANETADRPNDNLLPFPIAAIGGSSGGIEACIELFQHLPVDTGMAFIVVPHLARGNRGHFFEILARRSSIPVTMIEGSLRPEPNHVYVMPPHGALSIRGGMLELSKRPEHGAHMVVDDFFHSIAADQQNRAIGVLLSGMDDDGALGLKAIKAQGGIAIVQAPEATHFQNLPKGVAGADYVDLVLAPAEVGLELARLGSFYSNPELETLQRGQTPIGQEQPFRRILDLLVSVGNIDFRMYKPEILPRRVARRMLLKHFVALPEYLRYLEAHTRELRSLHEDLLFGATRFFRDRSVFDALKSEILPRILETQDPRRQVRIWSVGCSTGEEVYSLAIAVLEFLGGETVAPPIQIFGTDANDSAVRRARTGLFPESVANEVSPERLRRFFTKVDKGYQVSRPLRDLCIFARHDICSDAPFGQVDLISCRNLLVYLEPALQQRVVAAFHHALSPGGVLLVGSSETMQDHTDLFSVVDRKRKFYARLPSAKARPAGVVASLIPLAEPRDAGLAPQSVQQEWNKDEWNKAELQRIADQIVLSRYAPPGLIVDEKFEVRQVRGLAGSFLEDENGRSDLHLFRVVKATLAREVYKAVRQGVEKDAPLHIPNVVVRRGTSSETISLDVLPLPGSSSELRCFLVLFRRTPDVRTLGATPDTVLRHVLSDRNFLNGEQVSGDEEIQSITEEIQAATQELQSANEELEIMRGELQSANAELQLVNRELQLRNTALAQATNDLANLLNVLHLPLLVLDNELQVRRFTPMTERLMNIRASDIGRPIRELRLNLDTEELEPVLLEVLETLIPRELEVQDRDGHWRLVRARPYRSADNRIEGVVLVLLDIDELRSTQEELLEARDFSRGIIEAVRTPMAVLSIDLKVKHVNSAFRQLVGVVPIVFQQRPFTDLATRLWKMDGVGPLLAELAETTEDSRSFEFQHRVQRDFSESLLRMWARTLSTHGERLILVTIEEIVPAATTGQAAERFDEPMEQQTRDLEEDTQVELRALAAHLFASQEEERRTIAGELHEDITQQLAHLQVQMEELGQHLPESRDKILSTLERLGHKTAAVSEIAREISHRLHPLVLDELGFIEAIEFLLDQFRVRENLRVTLQIRSIPESIPDDIAGVLYRITQEALRYMAGNAGHTNANVLVEGAASTLRVEISAAGAEIDLQELRKSLALVSMAERARLVRGVFSIESRAGGGVLICVEVPFLSD